MALKGKFIFIKYRGCRAYGRKRWAIAPVYVYTNGDKTILEQATNWVMEETDHYDGIRAIQVKILRNPPKWWLDKKILYLKSQIDSLTCSLQSYEEMERNGKYTKEKEDRSGY